MFKDKDARMVVDESGEWTSLSCYYLLHDKVERLQGQVEYYTAALGKQEVLNQRLVKAGDELDAYLKQLDGTTNCMLDCRRAWQAALDRQP
jgi:hypothetical protein